MRAFSQKVAPFSSGSSTRGTSASVISSIGMPSSSGRISRTLFGFVVASRKLAAKDRCHDLALLVDQIVDAFVRERQQTVQRLGPERFFLRGPLDLDEAAVARLDDVHVDVGLRIFFIREIE